ncbi:helix-turn-helix transcriptional regulator [Micromonospora sp. RTP1Z1]|uniref:helix-turn-helix domain-containing protein n=1 Tax=Micromonospora sp. RTP1Z1 TaxID=2994043 RepID=UPI0029C7654C|nr:helix-turn-helix transcriptional regulator [Micromonospora sp. RTP1Z1]
MATSKDLPDVGGFIRDLRRNAKFSLRQLAEQAGVSNPYLSQIERGLRKPSAEVLQQLASALRVSTPAMYLRAGLLDEKEGQGVLAAIAVDPELTMAQKQSLTQIYETFRRENARLAEATAAANASAEPAVPSGTGPAEPPEAPATATPAATGPTTPGGTPTEAVLESVAVTEAGPAPAPTTTAPQKKTAPKAAGAAEEEKS